MIEQLQLSTFEPLIDQTFDIELPTGETFNFSLESVMPLHNRTTDLADPDRRVPFSLLLLGSSGISMPQGTYHFIHESVGEFDMFIVPIERRGDRLTYQAVFN
ncbi:MAG: hypothetical protein WBW04_18950 [Nitrolancea sp.]